MLTNNLCHLVMHIDKRLDNFRANRENSCCYMSIIDFFFLWIEEQKIDVLCSTGYKTNLFNLLIFLDLISILIYARRILKKIYTTATIINENGTLLSSQWQATGTIRSTTSINSTETLEKVDFFVIESNKSIVVF